MSTQTSGEESAIERLREYNLLITGRSEQVWQMVRDCLQLEKNAIVGDVYCRVRRRGERLYHPEKLMG